MGWIIISMNPLNLPFLWTRRVMHGHVSSQTPQTVICLFALCQFATLKSAVREIYFFRLCLLQLILHNIRLLAHGFKLNGSFLPSLIIAFPSTLPYTGDCVISYTPTAQLSCLGIRLSHGDLRSTLSGLSFDLFGVISRSLLSTSHFGWYIRQTSEIP